MVSSNVVAAGLTLLQGAHAYWRMPCGVIQTGRIDPLVNPGTISGHVHKIAGPPSINPNSTYDDLQDNRCTSCQVQADKSAYWTPVLYYHHANGSFEEVPANGMTVYYMGRGDNYTNIVPFPKGFRMLSGDPTLRAYDNSTYTFGGPNGVIYAGGKCANGSCTGGHFVNRTRQNDPSGPVFKGRPVADRVSFNCLDPDQHPETYVMDNFQCRDGLRAQLQFPSCWNGVDLYKPDQSHVAYMSQIDNGICPPTHPILFPHLFFEVLYSVTSITQDGGEFVFADGDPRGNGFHGDFLNGWDADVLQAAVDQCVNVDNGGDVSECQPFLPSLDLNSGNNCPEQPPLFDEAVHGMIGTKLPGCINITYGPAPATSADLTCPPNTTIPAMNTTYKYGGGSPPSNPAVGTVKNNYKYLGCFGDDSGHSFSKSSFTSDAMTNELCQNYCSSKNMPLAGVEYGRECYCGYSFTSVNTKTSCNSMICSGNSSEYCGSGSVLNTWNSTTYTGSYNPTLPSPGASIDGGYQYLGCANEATNSRALKSASTTSDNMTIEYCAQFCASQNPALPIFGLEYGRECYCGTALVGGSTLGQDGCNMQCAGVPPSSSPFAAWANICGGSSRLTVWNNTRSGAGSAQGSLTKVSSSSSKVISSSRVTSLSTSSKTASSVSVSVSVSSSTKLSSSSTTPKTASTVFISSITTATSLSQSLSTSLSTQARIAATSTISSLLVPSPSSTLANSPFVYLGCATEATSGRALNATSMYSAPNMTLYSCSQYCSSKSLPLFGVEYGSQCFCGNSLNSGAGSVLGASGCTKPCAGSLSTIPSDSVFAKVANTCGGSSRLNIWNNTKIRAVGNVQNFVLKGEKWAYKGCFKDATSGRALSGASWSAASGVNTTSCAGYCQNKGFTVAGVEYGGECYCGKDIASGLKADEWDCAMQCNGDKSSWCGGSSRLSVYGSA